MLKNIFALSFLLTLVMATHSWSQRLGATSLNNKAYIWMSDSDKVVYSKFDNAQEVPFQYRQVKLGVGPAFFASLDDHGVFWPWSKLEYAYINDTRINYEPHRITLGKYWIDFDVSGYVNVLVDSTGKAYQWGSYIANNYFDSQQLYKQKDSLTLIGGNVQIKKVYGGKILYGVSRSGALYKAINGTWVEILHSDSSPARV